MIAPGGLASSRYFGHCCSVSAPSGDPPPLVFPVFFVTGGLGLHTTTATADEHSLWIRTLAKPLRGARVTAGLYLGHAHDPLASIGWITEVSEPEADPLHAGFRAEFTDIDPEAIERILSLRNRSLTQFTRQRRYKTRLRVVTAEDTLT